MPKIENENQENESEGIKALRAKAEQVSVLEKKLVALERRDALREAGLKLDSDVEQALIDNPGLDIEVIKALAGTKSEGETKVESEVENQEQEKAIQEAAAIEAEQAKVSRGGTGERASEQNPLLSDPTDQAHKAYQTTLKTGGGRSESVTAAVAALRQAAEAGNKNAVYDPGTYQGYDHARYIRLDN